MCRTSTVFITACAPFSYLVKGATDPPARWFTRASTTPSWIRGEQAKVCAFIHVRVQLPSVTKRKEIAAKVTPRPIFSWPSPFCVVHDAPQMLWIYRHVVEMLGWPNRIWIWGGFTCFDRKFGFSLLLFVYFFDFGEAFLELEWRGLGILYSRVNFSWKVWKSIIWRIKEDGIEEYFLNLLIFFSLIFLFFFSSFLNRFSFEIVDKGSEIERKGFKTRLISLNEN